MKRRVLVAGGSPEALLQAARYARPLTEQLDAALEAVVAGAGPDTPSADAAMADLAGLVDRVYRYVAGTDVPVTGALLCDALAEAASAGDVGLVLLGDHVFSREAAARLAVRMDAPCVSMCDALFIDDGQVIVERSALGGVATAELRLEGGPPVCVLAPGAAGVVSELEGSPEVCRRELIPGAAACAVTLVACSELPCAVDLAGAKRVVSVGRGFSKADDIGLTEELRSLLEAELGCSRPVAEDFKWLPQERLVGLTGTAVTADLYLALGISGQVQHLAGIKGARVVAAVNSDSKSPITRHADYTIVGDLYKVVPALVAALKSRQSGI